MLVNVSHKNPAPPDMLVEITLWKLAGHKIILAISTAKPIGHIIPRELFGVPCRVVREASRDEYIAESPVPSEATAYLYGPNYHYYEIEALD